MVRLHGPPFAPGSAVGASCQNAPVPVLEPAHPQVSVANVAELVTALDTAVRSQTLMLADGIYDLSSVEPLHLRVDGLALYGASRDPSRVIFTGRGFASGDLGEEMIKIKAANATLAYLTLRDVRANGLKLQSGANHGLLLHNVHFVDICERSIKGPDVPVSRGGIVRYCRFEQRTPITSAIPNLRYDGDYVAGLDLMKVDGWRIHDNTFRNIRGRNGGGRAAVFLWNGCADVTVERNVFVGCDRAISLGNPSGPASDVDGGIIRDNLIVAGAGIAIEVCHASAVSIVRNTIHSANPNLARTVVFLDNGPGNELRDNLILGRLTVQRGAVPDTSGNLFVTSPGGAAWFREAVPVPRRLLSRRRRLFPRGRRPAAPPSRW